MPLPAADHIPRRKPLQPEVWYDHLAPLNDRSNQSNEPASAPTPAPAPAPISPSGPGTGTQNEYPHQDHQAALDSAQDQLPPSPYNQNPQEQHHLRRACSKPVPSNIQPSASPPTSVSADANAATASSSSGITNLTSSCASTPPHHTQSASTGPATANTTFPVRDCDSSLGPSPSRVTTSWTDDSFPSQPPIYPTPLTHPSLLPPLSPSSPQAEGSNIGMNASIKHSHSHSHRAYPNASTSSTISTGSYGVPASTVVVLSTLERGGSTSSRSTTGSGSTPTSYVSLLRKQKATVWCDRAQSVDPHLLAKQRAAREKVAREMVGPRFDHNAFASYAAAHARTYGIPGRDAAGRPLSTVVGAGRQKIRPHAAPPIPADISGSKIAAISVPQRLSASEVYDDEKDDSMLDTVRNNSLVAGRTSSMVGTSVHSRSGSGRSSSSIGSGGRPPGARSSLLSFRNFSSPLQESPVVGERTTSMVLEPSSKFPKSRTTSMSDNRDQISGYSTQPDTAWPTPSWGNYLSPPTSVRSSPAPQRKPSSSNTQSHHPLSTSVSGDGLNQERTETTAEMESEEPHSVPDLSFFAADDDDGEVAHHRGLTLHNPDFSPTRGLSDTVSSLYPGSWGEGNESTTTLTPQLSDELRRRGSVDDRSMTMSGSVRLYVANPDVSD